MTDKTRGDVQGGTLIQYEGKAKLVELSQVPREHEQAFKSLKTFTCFNTNNLWASLRAMKELVAANAIQPNVVVGERLLRGSHILELETAAGAAIEVRAACVALHCWSRVAAAVLYCAPTPVQECAVRCAFEGSLAG